MRVIGNILWVSLTGIWLALGYAISGLVLSITIIGIPFGIQAFQVQRAVALAVRTRGRIRPKGLIGPQTGRDPFWRSAVIDSQERQHHNARSHTGRALIPAPVSI